MTDAVKAVTRDTLAATETGTAAAPATHQAGQSHRERHLPRDQGPHPEGPATRDLTLREPYLVAQMSRAEFCARPKRVATGFHACTNASLAASACWLALNAAL